MKEPKLGDEENEEECSFDDVGCGKPRFRVVLSRVRAESSQQSSSSHLVDTSQHLDDGSETSEARQLRRRRSSSVTLEEVGDTIVEGFRVTSFLTRMSAKLIGFVGFSWFAWVMFWRLLLFALILLPGFLRIVARYFLSNEIARDFYGDARRQSVDIYFGRHPHPHEGQTKKPVIIFFAGGAWIIGYKAWGAFLGFCYSHLGFVFVTPDYRNFPQATVDQMVQDVDLAIDWCVENVSRYGGDENQIVVMGQSAGAHLAALSVLCGLARDNVVPASEELLDSASHSPRWTIANIKGFVGVSGPYNLETLCPHLNERGLNTSLLKMLFRRDYAKYSPSFFLSRMRSRLGKKLVCKIPIVLIHGTSDVTCPHSQSEDFHSVLQESLAFDSVSLSLELMPGLTHTDPIIEFPMRGSDPLLALTLKHLQEMFASSTAASEPPNRLLPDFLIDLARYVNPF